VLTLSEVQEATSGLMQYSGYAVAYVWHAVTHLGPAGDTAYCASEGSDAHT